LPAGTPIFTDQGIVSIEKIDTTKNTIDGKRIVAITNTITPEKNLVCFEANSMGINCPSVRTIMTPGHEVLYNGKLVQAKHFVGRVDGVHNIPYNGKDVLYNVLQDSHGLMRVNNMIDECTALCTLLSDVDALEQIGKVVPTLVRDLVTPDSLYLRL
jgi:hypothetical protein